MSSLLLAAESAHGAVDAGGWFLRNVWLIPLIPAISFVLILFLGKRTPGKGAPTEPGLLARCRGASVVRREQASVWPYITQKPTSGQACRRRSMRAGSMGPPAWATCRKAGKGWLVS